jgi:hypothetical protein
MCRRQSRRSRTTPAGIARGAYDSDSRAGYSFFCRVALLNFVAIAALVLLVASPALLADSRFLSAFVSLDVLHA